MLPNNKTATTQVARPLGAQDNLEIVGSSIRDENFRYNAWIRVVDQVIVAEELYDLSVDIDNATNLASGKRYLKKKTEMRDALLKSILYANNK